MNTQEAQDTSAALPISQQDQQAVQDLYKSLRQGRAKLVSPEGKPKTLPESLHRFLTEILSLLAQGKCVTLIENAAKLTTVEAASLLGVSRQYFVNLLEKNEISYHMVGTHRRVYARDLLAYKARRDASRRQTLRLLAKAEAEEGLYDRQPDDGD